MAAGRDPAAHPEAAAFNFSPGPRTVKQPYYISRRDGAPLAMAGIYELWRDRALPDDHERAWLWTGAIITTSAPDALGRIHDRMPMIIEKDRWGGGVPRCPRTVGGRGSGLRRSSPPARRTSSAGSMTGCR